MLPTLARRLAFVAILFMYSLAALAEPTPDLNERVQTLERKQEEMFEQLSVEKGKVKSFLQDELLLGGFVDTGFNGIFGTDTGTQLSTGNSVMAIDLAAELGGGFRLNSQSRLTTGFPLVNPNNNPNGPAIGLPLTRQFSTVATAPSLPQAYFEYTFSPKAVLQGGRGYSPFGIALQERDLALFRRRNGPQIINANSANSIAIAAVIWSGIHLSGTFDLDGGEWGYNAYTLIPVSDPGTPGGGLRAWWKNSRELQVGVSSQTGSRNSSAYYVLGSDVQLTLKRFGTQAEAAVNFATGPYPDTWTFYAEPYYTFFSDKLLLYGAIDYLDNPLGQNVGPSGTLPDPYRRWEIGGGVNWLPQSNTRFRFGVLYNVYSNAPVGSRNQNYCSLDLSAGVEF